MREAVEKLQLIVYKCSIVEKERLFLIPPETENLEKNRIISKRFKSDIKKNRKGGDRDDWLFVIKY